MRLRRLLFAVPTVASVAVLGLAAHAHPPQVDNLTVHLSMIVVATESQAGEIISRLAAGKAFRALATTMSIDASRDKAGDIGTALFSDLSEEFQDALRGLKTGEYTDPIRLAGHFYIFHVDSVYASETIDDRIEDASTTSPPCAAETVKVAARALAIPMNASSYKHSIQWRLLEYISSDGRWEVDPEGSALRGDLLTFVGDDTCSMKALSVSSHDGYVHLLLKNGCLILKCPPETYPAEELRSMGLSEVVGFAGYWKISTSRWEGRFVEIRTSRESSTSTTGAGVTFAPLSPEERATRRDMDYRSMRDEDLREIVLRRP